MLLALLALSPLLAAAAPRPTPWAQPADSPVAALFKRSAPSATDPNFASYYPSYSGTPPTSSIPAAWLAALNATTLPAVSVSTNNNGYPTYPDGESGTDSATCSFTYECTVSTDLFSPPNGVFALTFDDGPTSASADLYNFLSNNGVADKATHFMIGGNIMAFNGGGHIAVHTWSHPYMTTLTNEEVVAELGWTMQIIADLTGGRLPAFWRPPYGDVDNRVRAIAKGVFGLETVVWNQDSADWAVGTSSAYTTQSVEAAMDSWLTGSKDPGICALEHELSATTVTIFETEYPHMVANNWTVLSVPDAFGMDWYQNADGNAGDIKSTMSVAQIQTALAAASATSAAASGASAATSGNATSAATGMSGSATSASTASASSSSAMSATSASSTSAASSSSVASTAAAAASASSSHTSSAAALVAPLGWLAPLAPLLALLM